MSDTILIVYEQFDNVIEEKAILSFMFTVARRLIYKRTFFNKKIDGSKCFEADDISNDDFGPEKINQLNELNSALDKIPKKYKEAIVLTAINGFSYEEAADILQTKIANIKKRIYRGKQMLKELLD
jgi:RNA polymerase sigma-70 factor (ECF subfamily)